MGTTEEVVVRNFPFTFLSWSALHPYFLSFNHQKAGISTRIRILPLHVNAFIINQQALIMAKDESEKPISLPLENQIMCS